MSPVNVVRTGATSGLTRVKAPNIEKILKTRLADEIILLQELTSNGT